MINICLLYTSVYFHLVNKYKSIKNMTQYAKPVSYTHLQKSISETSLKTFSHLFFTFREICRGYAHINLAFRAFRSYFLKNIHKKCRPIFCVIAKIFPLDICCPIKHLLCIIAIINCHCYKSVD